MASLKTSIVHTLIIAHVTDIRCSVYRAESITGWGVAAGFPRLPTSGRGPRGALTVEPMTTFGKDPVHTYARYIAACNERRFGDLDEFIATDVEGVRGGVDSYRDGLRDITVAFPNFKWRIEDLIVEGMSMAARLTDTGTHHGAFGGIAPTGLHVQIDELAVYRIDDDGKIARCWVDLEAGLRSELLAGRAL